LFSSGTKLGKRVNGYKFKWDRMLSFEGDTGPYLQYSHSRLNSIVRNANIPLDDLDNADFSLLVEPGAMAISRLLVLYPDVIRTSLKTQEASAVVTYLFKLAHSLNSAYDQMYVQNQKPDIARARLALYVAARTVIGNAMRLLGLTPIER
jgi:arginyl-tRNA synthetase